MINTTVRALFDFIDFLHENTETFSNLAPTIERYDTLKKERYKLEKYQYYKDKLKYDELTKEMTEPHGIIRNTMIQPILKKAKALGICNDDIFTSVYNFNTTGIREQTECFEEQTDVPEIKAYGGKYTAFRKNVFLGYETLPMFFNDLDEVLGVLFTYFDSSEWVIFSEEKRRRKEAECNFSSNPKSEETQHAPTPSKDLTEYTPIFSEIPKLVDSIKPHIQVNKEENEKRLTYLLNGKSIDKPIQIKADSRDITLFFARIAETYAKIPKYKITELLSKSIEYWNKREVSYKKMDYQNVKREISNRTLITDEKIGKIKLLD